MTEAMSATDIFISYTRADRPRARLLADRLEAEGWSVWWDADLVPGDAWSELVEQRLAQARCVIVLWSTASVAPDKRWVRNEARDGLDRRILVPAMLDAVQLPVEFRGVQAADLVGWAGQRTHVGLQQLLTAVAVKLGVTVARNRPALARLAVARRGAKVAEAALRASSCVLSAQGQPLGTGFALRGADFVVTDANVHAGALARARGALDPASTLVEVRPFAGGGAGSSAGFVLPPESSLDVVLVGAAAGPSVIGLDERPARPGDAALTVVAAGPRPGVLRGRVTAVDVSSPVYGMPGGPARVDDLIQTDIVTEAGSAGAPLLRPDGSLLGVIVAGDERCSLAVPAARLRQRLLAAGFVTA